MICRNNRVGSAMFSLQLARPKWTQVLEVGVQLHSSPRKPAVATAPCSGGGIVNARRHHLLSVPMGADFTEPGRYEVVSLRKDGKRHTSLGHRCSPSDKTSACVVIESGRMVGYRCFCFEPRFRSSDVNQLPLLAVVHFRLWIASPELPRVQPRFIPAWIVVSVLENRHHS